MLKIKNLINNSNREELKKWRRIRLGESFEGGYMCLYTNGKTKQEIGIDIKCERIHLDYNTCIFLKKKVDN